MSEVVTKSYRSSKAASIPVGDGRQMIEPGRFVYKVRIAHTYRASYSRSVDPCAMRWMAHVVRRDFLSSASLVEVDRDQPDLYLREGEMATSLYTFHAR